MEIEYDPAADVLYVRVREGSVAESEELEDGIIVDFDRNGRVVGIEILNAKKRKIDINKIVFEPEKALPVMV